MFAEREHCRNESLVLIAPPENAFLFILGCQSRATAASLGNQPFPAEVSLRRLEMWQDAIASYVEHSLLGFEPQFCLSGLFTYLGEGEIHDIKHYQFVLPYARDVTLDDEYTGTEDARSVLRKLHGFE